MSSSTQSNQNQSVKNICEKEQDQNNNRLCRVCHVCKTTFFLDKNLPKISLDLLPTPRKDDDDDDDEDNNDENEPSPLTVRFYFIHKNLVMS